MGKGKLLLEAMAKRELRRFCEILKGLCVLLRSVFLKAVGTKKVPGKGANHMSSTTGMERKAD